MKINLSLLLVFLLFTSSCRDHSSTSAPSENLDPGIKGSHSHLLSYELKFNPTKTDQPANFVAILTNISKNELSVMVNDTAFHAPITIVPSENQSFEIYEEHYRILILTSEWQEPTVRMKPGVSIEWKVPLHTLRKLDGQNITEKEIYGTAAYSEMNVAIVPNSGNFVWNNATQMSPMIDLPKMKG